MRCVKVLLCVVQAYVPTLRSHEWVNNKTRRITNRNHSFIAMKNRTVPNSAQTWVTKTANHHSTRPDLFAGSHLLNAQKPEIECYVIERFIGTTA